MVPMYRQELRAWGLLSPYWLQVAPGLSRMLRNHERGKGMKRRKSEGRCGYRRPPFWTATGSIQELEFSRNRPPAKRPRFGRCRRAG